MKYIPRQYNYLLASPNDDKPKEYILELNEYLTENSLLIRDETINKFMVFESPEHYQNVYSNKVHLCHEIIMGHQKQKPKFDIDGGTESDFDDILEYIIAVFDETYHVNPDIIICDSSNDKKFSKHIIIANYCFANNIEAKWFNEILKSVIECMPCSQYIDFSVNKYVQNFRIQGSTKQSADGPRTKTSNRSLIDTLITQTKNCKLLPLKAEYKKKEIPNINNINISNELIKDLPIDYSTWRPGKTHNNLITFKRQKSNYCQICQRQHDNIGMYIAVHHDKITQHCYRSAGSITLKEIEKSYTCYYDVVKEYNSKSFDDLTIITKIKNALKQVVMFKLSGATSTVLLKVDTNEYELQKFSAFISSVSHQYININNKKYDFGYIFHKYPNEFSSKNIVFRPAKTLSADYINLFTGFATQPANGNINVIEPILDHIMKVWANNNIEIYNYILDWFANIIAGEKNGTAIIVYSKKHGAGKNVITDFIKDKVIGKTYSTQCNDLDQLTSKFNNKFANKILTIINEANNIEGGGVSYHKTFDKMKDLITATNITVERKGIDSFEVDDYNNYIITTNNEYPVKVEEYDRRYTFLKVNEEFVGDKEYFDNLHKYTVGEQSAAAASAFLYFLQTRQITNDVRRPLMTDWKRTLINLFKPQDLVKDFISQTTYTEKLQLSGRIYMDYTDYCNRNGIKALSNISLLRKLKLENFIGDSIKRSRREGDKIIREVYYEINDDYIIEINNNE